jgi:hypothetical protein
MLNRLLLAIDRATDFGTFRARETYLSFFIKILFFIFPAIIFGYYTDKFVSLLQNQQLFGNYIIVYLLLQTLLMSFIMFSFIHLFASYAKEFQLTTVGAFFVALFFGFQINYIRNIKQLLD